MSGDIGSKHLLGLGNDPSPLLFWTVGMANEASWNALSKRLSIRFKAESDAFTSTLNYYEWLLGPCP
jgi:hypothetical protein